MLPVLYSRTRKEYKGCFAIKRELVLLFAELSTMSQSLDFSCLAIPILDGEVWSYSQSLQDVSGIVRRDNATEDDEIGLVYCIYDLLDVPNTVPNTVPSTVTSTLTSTVPSTAGTLPFETRLQLLNNVQLLLIKQKARNIIVSPTFYARNHQAVVELFTVLTVRNPISGFQHEGIVVRDPDGLYNF